MEVGDDSINDVESVTGGDDNARASDVAVGVVPVEIIHNVLQGARSVDGSVAFVWEPLRHVELLVRCIGVPLENHTYII